MINELPNDFFINMRFNNKMLECFENWFYDHEVRYNSKAWQVYKNCKHIMNMNYIQYNLFIYETKQAILKAM